MTKGTIGVFGASGFVGSTLCERLYFEGKWDFVCFIRSSGNASRISRLPVKIRTVDILDQKQVAEALTECDIAVNCTLGNNASMLRGIANLTSAAKTRKLKKFIHLSSIAIYGQDPGPESATEEGEPNPGDNDYGIVKLRQDKVVLDLHRSGIPSFILCPGNITGPYSPFSRGLVTRLMAGPLPLVDGGRYASNMIHVDNLVEAILAAVRSDSGAGERYFVNETRPVVWLDVFEDFYRALGLKGEYVEVKREQVVPFLSESRMRGGLKNYFKIGLSGEFRRALSMFPVFERLNRVAATGFERMSPEVQAKIRERVQWPISVCRPSTGPSLDERYVKVQARRFYHSPAKLTQNLGWEPPLSYEEGNDTILSWLQFAGIIPARDASISVKYDGAALEPEVLSENTLTPTR